MCCGGGWAGGWVVQVGLKGEKLRGDAFDIRTRNEEVDHGPNPYLAPPFVLLYAADA